MTVYGLMLMVYLAGRLRSLETLGAIALAALFAYDSAYFKGHFPGAFAFLAYWIPIVNHLPMFLAGIVFYRLKSGSGGWQRYALLAACWFCQTRLFWDGGTCKAFLSAAQYQAMLAAWFAVFFLYTRGRLGFLANRPALYLGEISFCLYLCHQSLGRNLLLPGLMSDWGLGFRPAATISLACVIAIAGLVSRYVERPAMRWLRTRFAPGPSKLAMAGKTA